jgi:hypothetical protein
MCGELYTLYFTVVPYLKAWKNRFLPRQTWVLHVAQHITPFLQPVQKLTPHSHFPSRPSRSTLVYRLLSITSRRFSSKQRSAVLLRTDQLFSWREWNASQSSSSCSSWPDHFRPQMRNAKWTKGWVHKLFVLAKYTFFGFVLQIGMTWTGIEPVLAPSIFVYFTRLQQVMGTCIRMDFEVVWFDRSRLGDGPPTVSFFLA